MTYRYVLLCSERMKQRERMIELAGRIATLRSELAELESQLDDLIGGVREPGCARAHPVGRPGRNGAGEAMSARVVGLLESRPGEPFGPREIASALALMNIDSLRGTLARLARSGRIAKAGRGKFRFPSRSQA